MQADSVIAAILPDTKHTGCVLVQIGDETLSLPIEFVAELKLRVGSTIDGPTRTQLVHEARYEQAKRTALRLLARRPYTEAEMAARLERAELSECTERVIPWLKRLGYIDDVQFAERWVHTRAGNKGLGPRRLHYELVQRGVARDVVNAAVDLPESQIEQAVRDLVRKRRSRYRNLPPEKAYARLYGFLERRGFPAHVIHRVLRSADDNAEA